MASQSQRSKRHDNLLPKLDLAIKLLSTAKDVCGVAPAQIALGSACVLLTAIRDTMGNKQDFVSLGLYCADVCKALDRGLNGKRSEELSKSLREAIDELTATIGEIQGNVDEKRDKNWFSRLLNAKSDKDAIASWDQDLKKVLQVFSIELELNIHGKVDDISQKLDALTNQDGANRQHLSTQASIPLGELPPPAPKACFGRNDLIEEIVGHAENLEPIALIGVGGIGKTSIALTVLDDDRIKDRFGDNRRFVRCDKFSASHANFLAQLSKAIGSGVKNPEDLTPLRPLLSSKTMILFLDNAESILDPRGTDAREIYTVVEELSQFSNICLGITSRISTVPPQCKRIEIPTLPTEAACDLFYNIYGHGERSSTIDGLLQRLDFHTLSVKLLATVACHNRWDHDRLAQEWDARHAQVLRTDFDESLAATIELSLASPTFQNLGPNARELLGVIAFFPRGINENNRDWLFPTISNKREIFDKFCVLSLTSRSGDFITMLAPIRDYLCPQPPQSSPLLCATRDRYFTRLSVDVHPEKPGFEEARWITSEDGNVEHLLDVFTSINTDLDDVWDVCFHFMEHLVWLKPRQTVLSPKIEALSDDHPSKAKCLFELSQLFERVGNAEEEKRLLTQTLQLEGRQGDDGRVAQMLTSLCDTNRRLGRYRAGIQRAEEAMEIYERLGDTIGQAKCLNNLAIALFENGQLGAAEAAALRAINLVSEMGQESLVCECHQTLGHVYNSTGKTEEAIHHLETGLEIASAFNRHDLLFDIRHSLVSVLYARNRFNDANAHVERLKVCAADNLCNLGRAMEVQARIWNRQGRLYDAESEASRALEIYENLGNAMDGGRCTGLLQNIRWAMG